MIVADHQLSLAIGKEGQNARLAAKLTEWKIDIKSETQYRELLEASWISDFDEAVAADEAEREEAMGDDYFDEYDDELNGVSQSMTSRALRASLRGLRRSTRAIRIGA